MTSLGNKLRAIEILRAVMDNVSDVISAEEAETLNTQFALFGKGFELQKDEHDRYDAAQAKALYDRCFNIVKKEYSAKFVSCIGMQMMLEE